MIELSNQVQSQLAFLDLDLDLDQYWGSYFVES